MDNDLISRSAFAEEIETLDISVSGKSARWYDAKHTVLRMIGEAPAVDAVEVVRCGECSKRYTLRCALCVGQYSEDGESVKMVFVTKPDDFWCADGERRTDES